MNSSQGRMLLLISLLAFTLGTLPAPAAQNVTNHGVVWAVSYDADFLPNSGSSDPAWTTLAVGAGGSATVSGGILTLTNGPSSTYASMNNLTYWDGASGGTRQNTIEFRMRAQNAQGNTQYTGRYFWSDGTDRWFLQFFDHSLTLNSSAYTYALDTTAFHTYRIVQSNGFADVYIDNIGNQATPVLSGVPGLAAGGQNFTFFGHDSSNLKGRTEWDYVRWTNAGAFTIPEPATFTLVLAALAFLRRLRK